MTETRTMRIATGETREITTWFDNGWFTCPWCGVADPPETQHCTNPACWASKYATPGAIRAARERVAQQAAETEQRQRAAEAHAAAERRYREQQAALWAQRAATATQRGACLTCLRKSHWETEPVYRRHRSPDFHTAA